MTEKRKERKGNGKDTLKSILNKLCHCSIHHEKGNTHQIWILRDLETNPKIKTLTQKKKTTNLFQ